MNENRSTPKLCAASQCSRALAFEPRSPWPEGLPAVAVNGVLLAGFDQAMAFHHDYESTDADGITALFRSLYFDLSFEELAHVAIGAKQIPWFPISQIVERFGFQANESFFAVAKALLQTPKGFQTWVRIKKIGPQDLMFLLVTSNKSLAPLFLKVLNFNLPKDQGLQSLQMTIDLMQAGRTLTELWLDQVDADTSPEKAEQWLLHLKSLRDPELAKRDLEDKERMESLPWPGSSSVRWARQGERSGIELKVFVSNPTDLKNYLESLSKVQDLLEQDGKPGVSH